MHIADTVPMAFSTYYTSFSAKWPSFTHSFWAKWLYCSKWQRIFITILLTKLTTWSLWLTWQSPSTFSITIYMNPVHITSAMQPVINGLVKIGYIKNVRLLWCGRITLEHFEPCTVTKNRDVVKELKIGMFVTTCSWRQHRKNWNCKNYSTQLLLWVVAHSPLDGAGEGFSQAKVAEVFSHSTKKDSVGTIHLMTCYCTILNLQEGTEEVQRIFTAIFLRSVLRYSYISICVWLILKSEVWNMFKWHQCDWKRSVGTFSVGKVPSFQKVLFT